MKTDPTRNWRAMFVRRSQELLFMIVWLALLSLLVLACARVAHGQTLAQLPQPPIPLTLLPPPPPPPPAASEVRRFEYVQAQAVKEKKALVVFVGVPERPIAGALTVGAGWLSDGTTSAIIASCDGDVGHWLPITATDAEICALIHKAVTPPAVPFCDPFSFSNSRLTVVPAGDGRGARTAGPQFNPSHNCPTCGARVVVISGRGPGGTHTHTCPRDGTTWFH